MKIDDLLSSAKETLTVRRVFGDPYERDGMTIIPVATVAGGGGGGEGHDRDGQEGEGGGFGMTAKPAGVYVIADGRVRWQPVLDVNRLVTSLVALVAVVAVARIRLARVRSRESHHCRAWLTA